MEFDATHMGTPCFDSTAATCWVAGLKRHRMKPRLKKRPQRRQMAGCLASGLLRFQWWNWAEAAKVMIFWGWSWEAGWDALPPGACGMFLSKSTDKSEVKKETQIATCFWLRIHNIRVFVQICWACNYIGLLLWHINCVWWSYIRFTCLTCTVLKIATFWVGRIVGQHIELGTWCFEWCFGRASICPTI